MAGNYDYCLPGLISVQIQQINNGYLVIANETIFCATINDVARLLKSVEKEQKEKQNVRN